MPRIFFILNISYSLFHVQHHLSVPRKFSQRFQHIVNYKRLKNSDLIHGFFLYLHIINLEIFTKYFLPQMNHTQYKTVSFQIRLFCIHAITFECSMSLYFIQQRSRIYSSYIFISGISLTLYIMLKPFLQKVLPHALVFKKQLKRHIQTASSK